MNKCLIVIKCKNIKHTIPNFSCAQANKHFPLRAVGSSWSSKSLTSSSEAWDDSLHSSATFFSSASGTIPAYSNEIWSVERTRTNEYELNQKLTNFLPNIGCLRCQELKSPNRILSFWTKISIRIQSIRISNVWCEYAKTTDDFHHDADAFIFAQWTLPNF